VAAAVEGVMGEERRGACPVASALRRPAWAEPGARPRATRV